MDNNYLNNSSNNTNYNSDNMSASQTSAGAQQTTGSTQQNAYNPYSGQQNTYNAYGSQQSNAYGSQQSTYNAYGSQQNNGYNTQQTYNPYQQPVSGKKPKKARTRKGGFGATLGKCAAIALVFGLVAGGTFTGANYAGSKMLGITQQSGESKADSSDSSQTVQKATSTGSAQDLTDVSAITQEAMPSIVAITNTGTVSYQTFWGTQQQESQSAGSGIIIKQDDKYLYIATNNHVVANAESLTVQFCDNETVSCEVKGTDAADDLAVVKVALSSIKADTLKQIKVASVNDSDELTVGQGVIAIGNALGYGQSVTNGIISALGRSVSVQDETTGKTVTNNNMIQTNAAINPGNSGGALLNAQGEVIGINSAKYSDTSVEGFGYAIPMSDAMPIINQLIEREKVDESQKAFLGIQGQDISSDVAQAYNMPEGVYVYQVVSGSAADKAGIRQGDIITEFDGQSVSTMSQLKELMTYYKSGQKVKVKLERLGNGYEEQTIEVTLLSQSGVTSNK